MTFRIATASGYRNREDAEMVAQTIRDSLPFSLLIEVEPVEDEPTNTDSPEVVEGSA